MSRVDVAIIGAGPAGTAAAIHLAHIGVQSIVLVDRYDFPRDKTCGSGISPKGMEVLKELGVWEHVQPRAYNIKGLRLVTPKDHEIFLSGGESAAAIICCRRTFDHLLLSEARRSGVRFIPNFDVDGLLTEGSRVTGFRDRDGRKVEAKYTIVANGAHSRLTVDASPKQLMQAIMGWWDHVPFEPNHVEMVFDKMVVPCYGWLFPESPTRVNIGICYEDEHHTKNARTLFSQFLQKHYRSRLAGAVQVGEWKGHPISYSYNVGRLHSPGRLIIGEAGRMTHPATAEGIYQGMRSGIIAAEVLKSALAGSISDENAGATFEARCRRTFGLSFSSAKIWRGLVMSSMLDRIVAFSERPMMKTALGKLMAQM